MSVIVGLSNKIKRPRNGLLKRDSTRRSRYRNGILKVYTGLKIVYTTKDQQDSMYRNRPTQHVNKEIPTGTIWHSSESSFTSFFSLWVYTRQTWRYVITRTMIEDLKRKVIINFFSLFQNYWLVCKNEDLFTVVFTVLDRSFKGSGAL